jgi:DNA-directed RNA polymerase subunit E"
MAKKKVCKTCKILVDGDKCPLCKNANFSTNWQGRIYVVDPKRSQIAEKIGLKAKGEYAIKVKN